MLVVEQNKIELDYCQNCQGVWFDSGELELLLDTLKLESSHFIDAALNASEVKTSEKKRRCPICRQNMKKINLGQEPAVLIDACPGGHGLWFDGGELEQVIKQLLKSSMGTDSQQKVITFLGDTFKARD
jgi:uncharacterized protein